MPTVNRSDRAKPPAAEAKRCELTPGDLPSLPMRTLTRITLRPRALRVVTTMILACAAVPASAAAAPEPAAPVSTQVLTVARPAPDGSRLTTVTEGPGRRLDLHVHSAAMNTTLTVRVLRAADPTMPAPVLYLLNGAHGGGNGSSWNDKTAIEAFFADKQVTVVVPMGGAGSYFTDWKKDDPVLGRQKWKTFLSDELPPVIDSAFSGNGANAIAGISMAGTSVFQLAEANPGLYRAVASYSGCVGTSDPRGQALVAAVITRWSGDPANMWGPFDDPDWAANDPALHADRLAGTAVYVATGTGIPGPFDTLDGPGVEGSVSTLLGQLFNGGILEAVTSTCAHGLRDRLNELGVPAVFNLRPIGTHSWGYWEQDLYDSWPMITEALARPQ